MRRRPRATAVVEPPGRLVAFDIDDWLLLVDRAEYDPDAHRARRNGQPYGPVLQDLDAWAYVRAYMLWSSARHAWLAEHGWPGGLSLLDLLRQEVAARRQSAADRRP